MAGDWALTCDNDDGMADDRTRTIKTMTRREEEEQDERSRVIVDVDDNGVFVIMMVVLFSTFKIQQQKNSKEE